MIKVVGLLTRKPELTHEQFVKHWFEIHGPLAHAVPGVRRYVQSHIVGTRTRPDIPETDVEVDGIAELWYDDQAALARAAATPEMKRRPMMARCSSDKSRHSSSKSGRSFLPDSGVGGCAGAAPSPCPLPQGAWREGEEVLCYSAAAPTVSTAS